MIPPSSKIAVPAPVPSVSTISTPLPLIAPKPCTSASFMTRTGFSQRSASTFCRSKPAQHLGAEIGRGQHPPVAHRAREADRDPVERAEPAAAVVERRDQRLGRDRLRRGRHAHALADHVAVVVEQGELDAGAADIDGQAS